MSSESVMALTEGRPLPRVGRTSSSGRRVNQSIGCQYNVPLRAPKAPRTNSRQ